MKIKQKSIYLFFALFLTSMVASLIFGVSFSNPDAYAWNCGPDGSPNIPTGYSADADSCFNKNLQEANKDLATPMTAKKFEELVHACNEAGGDSDRECADAIATCAQKALDTSKCTDSEQIYHIADEGNCNDGRLSEGSTCKPLALMNQETLQNQAKIADSAAGTCDENNAQLYGECQKVADAAKKKCFTQMGLKDDGGLQDDTGPLKYSAAAVDARNRGDFQQCLKDEMIKNAPKDAAGFCKAAGGAYVNNDYKDPVAGSNNNVTKGCKNNFTDIHNEPACTAAGGKWYQSGGTDTADNKSDDAWGCMNPQGTADDPNANKKDEEADAAGVDGEKDTSVKGECGNAKTNLINCDGTGAAAINGVLKIVISVLTVLVGIAAVGGLAWASILYAKATDNQSSVSEARTLIQNIVIGLFLYIFLLAIVNFLVPGGMFK